MSDDSLTDYQITQLFDGLTKLESRMTKGFEDLHTLIDSRLKGRDERHDRAETRLDELERWRARQEGHLTILSVLFGALAVAAMGTLWRLLTA